jgi:methionyl-tRNA formyltransferase
MARVVFVGAYAYAREVLDAFPEPPLGIVTAARGFPRWQEIRDPYATPYPTVEAAAIDLEPDLIVVAGWRRLLPTWVVQHIPTVGWHSAKLPEYPGRAPVAHSILRGDTTITNTMLWLDDGTDTGDIIAERTFSIGTSPDAIYIDIGRSSAEMLRTHWAGLLDGTAPRRAQDTTRRGPEMSADAWARL